MIDFIKKKKPIYAVIHAKGKVCIGQNPECVLTPYCKKTPFFIEEQNKKFCPCGGLECSHGTFKGYDVIIIL